MLDSLFDIFEWITIIPMLAQFVMLGCSSHKSIVIVIVGSDLFRTLVYMLV
ncbi:hypothetical protein [Listeria floridensis]|uniref:hypothetical protein n=1 Tax=Listeria floridensis TaxID=1494962 RepID=UPI0004B427C5|nr:hypothetical protein [Listeria floridensis]